MKLPNSEHTSRPWRIHELTPDFRLEDVWALPTPGGPDDFPRLVREAASLDPSQSSSRAVGTLFAIRWKLGELLGWDDPDTGLGARAPTLRDRLPADLRDGPAGPNFDALPFTSLYLLGSERHGHAGARGEPVLSADLEPAAVDRHAATRLDRPRQHIGADEAGHERGRRPLVDVGGSARLLDRAIADQRQAGAHREGLRLVVRHVDHRQPQLGIEAHELPQQLVAKRRVETGKRLVEEQQRGVGDERPGQRQALPLTAG